MVHLNIRRQGLHSTREKSPYLDLEDDRKTSVVLCTTVDPSTMKEGKCYADLCGRFPTTSIIGNKCIYVMYIYDYNGILTTYTKNRSEKEMIRAFIELIEVLKTRGINPESHFMANAASTPFKMTMTTMDIQYQLVPPRYHRENNTEKSIQTFKNHFILVLNIVDK